ncbi:SDR family NAD(P)-dependent oxidoreductase [Nocardiopsis aegyptia]|uniref:NAD(P)-dependent dehydrogenase (Short-subunit alcohol dehydrogenase family) n=1 Tax=Nocardiopsis aegyptia TaxID=220378 RepID=A0A7Z0EJ69_9ACTN|nr:SDR family oxidoreductase [Nocardiopsis aegyptia]NYJ32571.1 NAD(P)-dependent dehydrogenase (short-subunit alcohol dehydrogenase family) [Nocardiopsis aegyptia]
MSTAHPTAIITGGTGGMGLATAGLMGDDHRIVLADLDRSRLDDAVGELAMVGIEAIGVVCDITDKASVEHLFQRAESEGRHVRAVVHSAGVSPHMGTAERIARINATGTVNIARAFLARSADGDALVNVASTAGHSIPKLLIPRRAFRLAEHRPDDFEKAIVTRARVVGPKLKPGLAYAISKNFVHWYSRFLAAEFGERGARVVSVSPGSFDTDMGRLEENHGAGELVKSAAIKRFGKPEEIAAVLAFCASEAPGYLTGVDILVDGGTKAGKEFSTSQGRTL